MTTVPAQSATPVEAEPRPNPAALLPDVPLERIPRHIAIIMDGNGRWATERGDPRSVGHLEGVKAARRTLETCSKLGVEVLTLFSFSSENWKRPTAEISALMGLYCQNLRAERDGAVKRNIRFRQIGRRDGLPKEVLHEVDEMVQLTSACTGPTLCLAINYGSRAEITDAVCDIARRVQNGELAPEDITENVISQELSTAGLPDPDLLIRTAGEMRISNFLLWQISYAELYVTDTHWPAFDEAALLEAIRDYASRERRFGGLKKDPAAPQG